MSDFKALGLSEDLIIALEKLNITTPTEIQAKTIPFALAQRDVLGAARTGTGKTLAFSVPLISHLRANSNDLALILVPTRELAQQVNANVEQMLGRNSPLKTATLIGGEAYMKQFSQLRMNPRIIIGTPGRVMDHIQRRSFKMDAVKFFVLDETDRMFDMGFAIQLDAIMEQLPEERQTLMFSATFPPKIEKLASKFLKNPEKVFVNSVQTISSNLTEEVVKVKEADKYSQLCDQLNAREGSIIVFVKTKIGAENLADELRDESHSASAIHGDLKQEKRERLIHAFRKGKYRIMIATDVAARGLDIPHIQHVINYDIPHCPEDYIHRIGRTARAGASGSAISFISSQDGKRWDAIQRLMNPELEKERSKNRPSNNFDSKRPAKKFGPPKRVSSFSSGSAPEKKFFSNERFPSDGARASRPFSSGEERARPSNPRFPSDGNNEGRARPSNPRFPSDGNNEGRARPSNPRFPGDGNNESRARPSNNRFPSDTSRRSEFRPNGDNKFGRNSNFSSKKF